MSDVQDVTGVKITQIGGGWYQLDHPSLPESEKVHGKDAAEARARAIAGGTPSEDDGSGPIQQDALPTTVPVASTIEQPVLGQPAQESPAPPAVPESILAELAALREQNAKLAGQLESAQVPGGVKTVVTDGGAAPDVAGKVPGTLPRKYDGILDDARKAEMKRLGIEMTDIYLEENELIPPTGLFIGHNGRGYTLVPGAWASVPNFLIEVLDHAEMSQPIQGANSKIVGWRNRTKYPYRRRAPGSTE